MTFRDRRIRTVRLYGQTAAVGMEDRDKRLRLAGLTASPDVPVPVAGSDVF